MDTPETRGEHLALVPLTLAQRSSLIDLLDKAQEEWGAVPGDDALRTVLQAPEAAPSVDPTAREEAVRDIAMTYDATINEYCVGQVEEEAALNDMRNALRALGVTDAEIEAWT